MVTQTKYGSAQYSRILSAYVVSQDIVDAAAASGSLYLGDLPGNAFLRFLDTQNVAYTGGTPVATLALELVDPVDDSQLVDLGSVNLVTGGRIHTAQNTVARVDKSSRLKATPSLTDVTGPADVELYLEFFSTGATDESLD